MPTSRKIIQMKAKLLKVSVLTLIISITPLAAWATLGEDSSSIMNDANVLNAKVSQATDYSVAGANSSTPYQTNVLETVNGITIKQFVYNGKVFAVAWHGSHVPDQNQLFGKYFATLQNATPSYKSVSARQVNSNDFVSATNGWMGHYEGKALIPSLAPANVSINNVK